MNYQFGPMAHFMGLNAMPNPAFDTIDNATDFAAYAIRHGLPQENIDGRIDNLARHLGAMK